MIRSQKIILIVVAAVLVASAGVFGIVVFVTWGDYEYSDTFYYKPGSPSLIEVLNIECDTATINIKYNKTPTDFYAKIDLDLKVSGAYVEGKSYSDFFKPYLWDNTTNSPVTFDIDNKPSTWFIFGLSHRSTLNVTLRTDVIYEIDASSATGAIIMDVPEGSTLDKITLHTSTGSVRLNSALNTTFQDEVRLSTSTGSVKTYATKTSFTKGLITSTSTGSLTLNFTSCIFGDDLSGVVSTGSITLKSYNMKYTQDCDWDIETSTGSINAEILQFNEMGANVNCSLISSTGNIDILYKDDQINVGARFTSSTSTGSISYTDTNPTGFHQVGNSFTSLDYSTGLSKYRISLIISTGNIVVDAESA